MTFHDTGRMVLSPCGVISDMKIWEFFRERMIKIGTAADIFSRRYKTVPGKLWYEKCLIIFGGT